MTALRKIFTAFAVISTFVAAGNCFAIVGPGVYVNPSEAEVPSLYSAAGPGVYRTAANLTVTTAVA